MNIASLEGLINNAQSTEKDTEKLLEMNVLKDEFIRRLVRMHDSFFGYVDFMQKNLDFFVKNGLARTDSFVNGYNNHCTTYKFGNSKTESYHFKNYLLSVRTINGQIAMLATENLFKSEAEEFGILPDMNWGNSDCVSIYPEIYFLDGTATKDKLNDIIANISQPSWYKNFNCVEEFKKRLEKTEKYYFEILPKMIEACVCRIKEEIERKNAVIRSSVGNKKNTVRKITITITEDEE